MYKFVVVTDSDRASGFRLAGAEVIEAADAAEARSLIPPFLYRDDIGIVAVNEEFMLSLDEKVMDRIEKMHLPLIIPLPSKSKEVERNEAEIDLLIKLAETETAMRRLGSEIQMNRRRVNTLEQIMIPELRRSQAKFIKNAIEEREDLFRLKKVKSILDRKKKKAKKKKMVGKR